MRRLAAVVLVGLLACAAPADAYASASATAKVEVKQQTKAKAKRCAKTTKARAKAKAKRCPKPKPKPKAKPKPAPATPGTQEPAREGGGATSPAPESGSGGTTPSGGGGGGGSAPVELNAVGVKAYDRSGTFTFETTRTTVRVGELTVSFHNYDLDEHNLWLEGTAPLVSPLKLSDPIPLHGDVTATVTLAAGAYRFFCTVPGHASMTRALTVQ